MLHIKTRIYHLPVVFDVIMEDSAEFHRIACCYDHPCLPWYTGRNTLVYLGESPDDFIHLGMATLLGEKFGS